ncbi:hypothetical protein RA269_29345, partial [Pseudomonas syringae pv. tagetis]|uniref:hypothetical protein n=1 Tax=Pseudomonas syringae group genomosp. 7 TaxID=251699 RepID=UPI00377074E8
SVLIVGCVFVVVLGLGDELVVVGLGVVVYFWVCFLVFVLVWADWCVVWRRAYGRFLFLVWDYV